MRTRLIYSILFCATLFPVPSAFPAGTPNFDGVWIVEGTTDVGPCDKTFRGEVRVEHNDIVAADGGVQQAIGSIDTTGSVWARLTRSDGLARASGHIKGVTASGAWSSNTAYCGGRWRAHRAG